MSLGSNCGSYCYIPRIHISRIALQTISSGTLDLSYHCIYVRDLHKKYGANDALRGIDLTVSCGERVALLGPNGAGKSTTLKILAGLLKPDSGEVSLQGRPPNSPEAKRMIGYLPEDASPYLTLSVRENLEYIGAIRNTPDLKERIDTLLDMLDLREYEKSRTSRLSRGNRQKLALALSIVHSPKIILMDEPLNYLDIPTQEKVINFMMKMDATFLVSTHIMSIAERLTQKCVIISSGSNMWEGTLAQLKGMASPETPIESIVARLMNNVS